MAAGRRAGETSPPTVAGKENPAVRGFPISAPFTNGKRGADPKVLAGTSSGGPTDPNFGGSRPKGRDASQVRNRPPHA